MEKGYYKIKFYNHDELKIMYWNGRGFEGFPSDNIPNDEIETYEAFSVGGGGAGDDPD